MPVHINDVESTVDVQADSEPTSPRAEVVSDEVAERMRHERYQKDRERLHAEGYAD